MSVSQITYRAVQKLVRRVLGQMRAKKPMTGSQWADEYFYLSKESSYTAGKWKTQPMQVAPLNSMCSDDIQEVYIYKGARTGNTKMQLITKLYLVEHKGRNVGFYREDDTAAKKYCEGELDMALRDCEVMHPIFPGMGKRGPGNNAKLKIFLGALMRIQGGQSAGSYRGDSLDAVEADEADAFVRNVAGKLDKEGDPFMLMFKRTNGSPFPKRIVGSTPTKHGSSHIQRLSKRAKAHLRLHVACPHCGEEQHLEWTHKHASYGFKWDNGDPETVRYQCRACQDSFTYAQFLELCKACYWRDPDNGIWTLNGIDFFGPDDQPVRIRRVCYRIPGFLSPTDPWRNMVERWYDQKDDPVQRQTFINTDLGEVWVEQTGEELDHQRLLDRREKVWPAIPERGVYVTSFTDVQTSGRLETTVVAHGLRGEMWALDHKVHPGDPSQPKVWNDLEAYLRQTWLHASGRQVPISRMGIDTGGHYFDEVIAFAGRFPPHQVIPCKGSSVYGDPVANYHRTTKGKNVGTWLCHIGTDSAKETWLSRFKLDQPTGPAPLVNWLHLPHADWCNARWAQQATNMVKVLESNGRRMQWVFKMPNKALGDEALDCLVGNLAILRLSENMFGLDLARLTESFAVPVTPIPSARPPAKSKKAGRVVGGL